MRFLQPVLFVTGFFLLALAACMLLPVLLSWYYHESAWQAFLLSALICFIFGGLMSFLFRPTHFSLSVQQMFLLTTVSWLTLSMFAALPLLLLQHISYTDAFFETMSGITTTGSTVLVGLDTMSPSILLWRSLLQWLGGIGFIATGVAILPFLKVGGMRLFRTESSEWSDKSMPRTAAVAKSIVLIYGLLTAACAIAYYFAGMSKFEALNHAMTTLSTGGYSTSDASMGHFSNPAIHWLSTLFMLLGSLPFLLYVQFLRGDRCSLLCDQQVRGFLLFIASASTLLAVWLWQQGNYDFLDALRLSSFNLVSVVTTTGYALGDYSLWGEFAVVSFFYLTFVGGCSGSTAGGFKIFRFQLALLILRSHLLRLLFPHAVVQHQYNGGAVSDEIMHSLVAFSFFFGLSIGLLALLLSLCGLDSITALSASATAVANVGPGLGEIIGPAGNFTSLPDAAKWLLCFGMLLGRLEVVTVLVLFTPIFWRD